MQQNGDSIVNAAEQNVANIIVLRNKVKPTHQRCVNNTLASCEQHDSAA